MCIYKRKYLLNDDAFMPKVWSGGKSDSAVTETTATIASASVCAREPVWPSGKALGW